jgi:hypothetical protein
MKRLLLAGALLMAAAPAGAQQAAMPESYRQVQADMLALQRKLLLAMVDSMPESLYQDKVTEPQRDFAGQIAHAAWAVPFVAYMTAGKDMPALPDSASSMTTRAGLRTYVNASFDVAEKLFRSQAAADRNAMVEFFGIKKMPVWQTWDEIHQHTFWTAGQIVANFRKHGMAPPGFGFF